jgi:hypothetical protein
MIQLFGLEGHFRVMGKQSLPNFFNQFPETLTLFFGPYTTTSTEYTVIRENDETKFPAGKNQGIC